MCGQDPVEGFDLVKDTIHFYASFFHIPIIQNVIEFDLLASYDPPSDVSDITTSRISLSETKEDRTPKGVDHLNHQERPFAETQRTRGRYTGTRPHATFKTQPEVEISLKGRVIEGPFDPDFAPTPWCY